MISSHFYSSGRESRCAATAVAIFGLRGAFSIPNDQLAIYMQKQSIETFFNVKFILQRGYFGINIT